MSRQEEADRIIREVTRLTYFGGKPLRELIDAYSSEHLKPKDPLFEKWKGFAEDWVDERQTGWVTFSYDAFKELFADELNGTNGLDYAIEHYKLNNVGLNSANSIVYVLTEIKAKYN